MFTLLESIGNFFTSVVNYLEITWHMLASFLESVLEVVSFALGNGIADYLPAFILPVFVLLVVYAVIKLIINRE